MEGGGEPTWTFPRGPAQGAAGIKTKPGSDGRGPCGTGAGRGLDLASSQASGLINDMGTEPGERVKSDTHNSGTRILLC